MGNMQVAPFDAVVLMSFGGPEKPEDVLPFLQNVTRGRGIPDERLEEVGEHYYMFGGKSPINEQNQALQQAVQEEFAARGIDTPLLWGNRNWEPYLTEVVGNHARRHGSRRFLAIDTSAYSSYSSCRQYREDFAGTVAALQEEGLEVVIDKVRQYYNHPGFAHAQLDCVRKGLKEFKQLVGGLDRNRHKILYVTHSIPTAMQESSQKFTAGYQRQHEELMAWIGGELAGEEQLDAELVYCSRSGSMHTPWLEPDINDRMRELAETGTEGVLVVPLGFVSDHMEVKFDLDTEAADTARELGMAFLRAGSVGTSPSFVSGLVDLVLERAAQVRGEQPESSTIAGSKALGPGSGACSLNCCEGTTRKNTVPNWSAGVPTG
ncbi:MULTISPECIES: ferrochelatase [unclassified Glutamicibacter]|uniref:ferrochelatase n=1 Tax=unclassified Glutamicibacter TaxID=2627139 RepID=UPI00382040D9